MRVPKITVVGDLMIDHYLWGSCERVSPEAPVQIVDIHKETTVLGGAGNVVSNLVALGASVTVISAVGDDKAGEELCSMLQGPHVTASLAIEEGRKTTRKTRIIALHQQVIRYDAETRKTITEQTEKEILRRFEAALVDADVVLLSDYGKGVLSPALTQQIIRLARSVNKKVLVDPKGTDYSKYADAYLLTPNKKEAAQATGIAIDSIENLTKAIIELKDKLNLSVSIITLSEEGIAFFDDALTIKEAAARDVFDVTGAGDTVLAALGYKLAQDCPLSSSVEFANLAAGVVVAKIGSATATLAEIDEYKASLQTHALETQIKTRAEMSSIAIALRNKGKKIVFTNGCFDILHRGHVSYLKEARRLGDVLVVGLNGDASVKRLKGEDRPINSEEDRAVILSALECVDYVVIFNEDTPYELIEALGVNILVKGGDYSGKSVVGSDLVDDVRLIPFVEGKSTTAIINSVRKTRM